MKVVVFGASGKVGQKVVATLLERGHTVTAFVFGESAFSESDNLKVIQGNVKTYDDVMSAVTGNDAVISALGSWGTKSKDILSAGMRNIVPAMEASGVSYIVSLTGADARAPDDHPNPAQKMLHSFLGIVARKILEDGERHIQTLASSALDWTIVRSPVMNEHGSVEYNLTASLPYPWATIHRSAVANAMVDVLESESWIREAPIISRK